MIPQYSTSRLIERLVDEGLAVRRECEIDKRGQFVEITEAGRELQEEKCGAAYSAAIEKHIGSKLSDVDALKLCGLLDRLGCTVRTSPRLVAGKDERVRAMTVFALIFCRYRRYADPAQAARVQRRSISEPEPIWRVTRSI